MIVKVLQIDTDNMKFYYDINLAYLSISIHIWIDELFFRLCFACFKVTKCQALLCLGFRRGPISNTLNSMSSI